MGLPKPLQFVKDLVTEEAPEFFTEDIPSAAKWVQREVTKTRGEGLAYKDVPAVMKWMIFGGRYPGLPEEEPLVEQARKARTEEDARRVIDLWTGGPPDTYVSENLLKVMSDRGMVSRVLFGIDDRAGGALSLDPFSEVGSDLLRIGGTRDVRGLDPYYLGDTLLQEAFKKNPELQLAYLRETDPLSVMPMIVETSENEIEGSRGNKNPFLDIAGRVGGSLKTVFLHPLAMWDRIEEGMGHVYFNDIRDPYVRHQMAGHFYDYTMNPWDWHLHREHDARHFLDDLMAQDLSGDQMAEKYDEWFNENVANAASFAGDLFGKVLFDPLWFIPTSWIAKPATAGMKAITGAPRWARLLRFVSPSGRAARKAGNYTWRQVFNLPEMTYSAKQFAAPGKGPLRVLFELDPRAAGRESGRRMLYHVAPISDEVFKPGNEHLVGEIMNSVRSGKATPWVEKTLPGLMDDPAIARIHSRATGKDWLSTYLWKVIKEPVKEGAEEGSYLAFLDDLIRQGTTRGATEEVARKGLQAATEKRLVMLDAMSTAADDVVRLGQKALFRQSALGKLLDSQWTPIVSWMRPWVVAVSINNVGFIYLNVVANFIRHMWSSARHPLRGAETFGRSMWLEFGGKTWPRAWERMLRPHGLAPLDIEISVVRNEATRELLGRRVAEKLESVNPRKVGELLTKQSEKPVRDLLNKFRWKDFFFWPVNAAAMVDRATRRATYMLSLGEQMGWGTLPSWMRKTGIYPVADELVKLGVDPENAKLAELMVIDRVRAYATGARELPAGRRLDEALMREIFEEVGQSIETGAEGKLYSATDVLLRWAKNKGMTDEQAATMIQDLMPFTDQLYTEVLDKELPRLISKEITSKQFRDMVDARVLDYYGVNDVINDLGNVPSFWRPRSTYQDYLRLTERAMRQDMVDNVAHLQRHLEQMFPLYDEMKLLKRDFTNLAHEATVENARRLSEINRVVREGAREGRELAAGDIAKLWDDYFKYKEETHTKLYDWLVEQTQKVSTAHVDKRLRPWHEAWTKANQAHREAITGALSANTDEAWAGAAETIRKAYEENALQRGQIFGWGPNDLPSANQVMDATGPLAAQVDDFAQFLLDDLRKALPNLRKGKLEFGGRTVAAGAMRRMSGQAYEQWRRASQQMLANAMTKTDFVMLNYNMQYGGDRVMQMFAPYVFWPSRDIVHWGVRAARAPGAFASLWIAMMEPKEYAERFGYPQRLEFEIPIPMPFLDDALHDMPILRDQLSDVNFGPVYWIDPMRFVFPFTDFRERYDDERRRGTPMGLMADWMEQYTPFNMNPFMKILGSETGLMDSDAWASVQFGGGPFGIPMTTTAQRAARWLYGGDLDAIPEEEMYTYTDEGHFTIPFLGKVLGLEPDRFDIYRAERALWALAATDKLLPGKPHDEQVRAAWEAMDTHKGVAWSKALRSSEDEGFLRQLTHYIGFPAGGVVGMQEGEWLWISLRQAYSEAAQRGELDKFFEKYPEFEVRSALVKGMNDPKEKQIAIDTELYYRDVERLVKQPYAATIEEIEGKLDQLASLTQTEVVQEQRDLLLAELENIRTEQGGIYDMLANAYPLRRDELSLRWPPRERALRLMRNEYESISRNEGEDWEEYRQRQESFLDQFPAEGEGGYDANQWEKVYQQQLLILLEYTRRQNAAAKNEDWDAMDQNREWREAKLQTLHDHCTEEGLTRKAVESFLASWWHPRTPEQIEFEQARDMRSLWMSLVSRGSPFTNREKAAISDYFRAQPLIQKHYPLSVIPLEEFNMEQRLALLRRDEIWETYHNIQNVDTRLDYIKSVADELKRANAMLGLPPLHIIDYETPPPDLGLGDPLTARMEMMLAAQRERGLEENADPEIGAETLKAYSELLAADPNDPSPLSTAGLDWLIRLISDPDEVTE